MIRTTVKLVLTAMAATVLVFIPYLVLNVFEQVSKTRNRSPLTNAQVIEAAETCEHRGLKVRFNDDGYGRPVEFWCGSE